ncbi:MAG: DUF4132 domain-containing protein [Chloroflexi bacterium]|nr:DUF4132 domain-containing protein [Chloroflexota bacterium]
MTTTSTTPVVTPTTPIPPDPRLNLKPADWRWATWRKAPPLPRPAPKPFDKAATLERLRKGKSRYNIAWDTLGIAPSLTNEEAHFWLDAMAYSAKHPYDRKALIEHVEAGTHDGLISTDAVKELVAEIPSWQVSKKLLIPVATLLPLGDLVSAVCANEHTHGVIHGVQEYVWPYWTDADMDTVREHLREPIASLNQFEDANGHPALVWPLAALVGGFDEAIDAVMSKLAQHTYWPQLAIETIFGLSDPERVRYHLERLQILLLEGHHARAWLAHMEGAGLDLLYRSVVRGAAHRSPSPLVTVFKQIELPEMAPYMLSLRERGGKLTRQAQDWLAEHPDLAAQGLVETAVAPDATEDNPNVPFVWLRQAAREFLRVLKTRDHEDVVRAAIATLPEDQQAVLQTEVLDYEAKLPPTFDDDNTPDWIKDGVAAVAAIKRPPKVNWIDFLELPIVTIDGFRLNQQQGQALLIALAKSTINAPMQYVLDFKAHANATDLDGFAWALFEHWEKIGGEAKEKWALYALGWFGNDASVMKLTPLINKWPGESKHKRAEWGLDVLSMVGTDTALMHLTGVARKAKFSGIKRKAQAATLKIAETRGLTIEQLEDRIVPDCDLDADGRRTFDYGPRQFTFQLNSDMKPVVRDGDGKLRGDLPKPNKSDDSTLAPRAQAEWKLIKKQVREVTKTQIERLQQALIARRAWSPDEFEAFLVKHPLMIHLARLFVWGSYDAEGKLVTSFRVTDESDYANVEDDEITLNADLKIRLVHPIDISAAALGAWGEILSDYEIVTPFPQLARPIYTYTPEEADEVELTRFADYEVEAIALVGILEKKGWTRGRAEDNGVFFVHSRQFQGVDITVFAEYEGIPMGLIGEWDPQSIDRVYFVKGLHQPWDYGRFGSGKDSEKRLKMRDVPPLVFSEAVHDLTVVAQKAAQES